jgi:glycosyltransferase involved in cell wall biosynthesis
MIRIEGLLGFRGARTRGPHLLVCVAVSPETVGIDATPLQSSHAMRGIGRYVTSVLSAITTEHADWTRVHLRTLLARGALEVPSTADPWRTKRPGFRPQDTAWAFAALADHCAVRVSPPNVWHQTDPATPFGPLPADRTIATLYDLIPLADPLVRARIRPHRWLIHQAYLRLVREARLVIAISHTSATDAVERLGVDPARIRVVYPAVSSFRGLTARPLPDADIVELLFVGVPEPHKRPDLAVRTLAELRRRGQPATLRLVGPQPHRDVARLTRLAADLDVTESVVFTGRVDDVELGRLYRRSILLALSSLEGFGLPPVEAVLSGGRVVATPTPIYRETLADGALFAPAATPGSLADTILAARHERWSPNVRMKLARRYSPRSTGDALLTAYRAALVC